MADIFCDLGAAKRKMGSTHSDEPRVKQSCAGGTTAEDILYAKQPPPYPDHLTASTNGTDSDDAPADLSMPGLLRTTSSWKEKSFIFLHSLGSDSSLMDPNKYFTSLKLSSVHVRERCYRLCL